MDTFTYICSYVNNHENALGDILTVEKIVMIR